MVCILWQILQIKLNQKSIILSNFILSMVSLIHKFRFFIKQKIDTVSHCFKRNTAFMKYLSLVALIMVNYSVIIACSVQLGNFFHEISNLSTLYTKMVLYAFAVVIIIFALEPEKFKYIAMFSSSLIFIFCNFFQKKKS